MKNLNICLPKVNTLHWPVSGQCKQSKKSTRRNYVCAYFARALDCIPRKNQIHRKKAPIKKSLKL